MRLQLCQKLRSSRYTSPCFADSTQRCNRYTPRGSARGSALDMPRTRPHVWKGPAPNTSRGGASATHDVLPISIFAYCSGRGSIARFEAGSTGHIDVPPSISHVKVTAEHVQMLGRQYSIILNELTSEAAP